MKLKEIFLKGFKKLIDYSNKRLVKTLNVIDST